MMASDSDSDYELEGIPHNAVVIIDNDDDDDNDNNNMEVINFIDSDEDADTNGSGSEDGEQIILNDSSNDADVPFDENNGPQQVASEEFDLQLPTRHEYLGQEMEELAGRVVLDEVTNPEIPLISLGILLVPGQTLPFTTFHSAFQNAIRRCVVTNRVFGIVNTSFGSDEHDHVVAQNISKGALGTTAEIYEFQEEADDARETGYYNMASNFALKAKGRQRFNVESIRRQADGNLMARVKIRPEIILEPFMSHVIINATNHYMFPILNEVVKTNKVVSVASTPTFPSISNSSNENVTNIINESNSNANANEVEVKFEEEKKVYKNKMRNLKKFYSALTPFPYFVYEQFDEEILVEKIHEKVKGEMKSLTGTVNVVIPSDPTDLSYWLAQNLTFDDSIRTQILKFDSPIQRLKYEWNLLDKATKIIKCRHCENILANYNDIFCMSIEGPTGTYVNPGGVVHELLTVTKIDNISYYGSNSTEASWFPGYAWKIANCGQCSRHVGWRFKATRPRLIPTKFWGMASRSVNFKYDFNSGHDRVDLDAPRIRNNSNNINNLQLQRESVDSMD